MLPLNKTLKVTFSILVLFNLLFLLWYQTQRQFCPCQEETPAWEQDLDFSKLDYDNETGVKSGCYIVPNYIHFIRFNNPKLSYVHMICILAALKNQKPDRIYFHTNLKTFKGKYWKVLKNIKAFMDVVIFNYVSMPTEIFGQPLDPFHTFSVYHAADVTKLRMLMEYGGIMLDLDTYIVNSLNTFRVFEMTLNWDQDQFMGSQLLIGHKDSRFLKQYLESYRGGYNANLWYYNAGERPTTLILNKHPELVHRVKLMFGAKTTYIFHIFHQNFKHWKIFYAFHLLINHQYLLANLSEDATYPVNFNEKNIGHYPITFRTMAYDVYDIAGNPWPKNYLEFRNN